jgi:hypothetical protein
MTNKEKEKVFAGEYVLHDMNNPRWYTVVTNIIQLPDKSYQFYYTEVDMADNKISVYEADDIFYDKDNFFNIKDELVTNPTLISKLKLVMIK